MSAALEQVLGRPDVWRGNRSNTAVPALASGNAGLDRLLPGGGWPLGALSELCYARAGLGELSLLMPALAALTRAGRWVALVDAPHPLYAPALAHAGLDLARTLIVDCSRQDQGAWAAEQALRSGACGGVVLWADNPGDRELRRLQLAAESTKAFCAVLRPLREPQLVQSTPAALRVAIETGRRLRTLKCRGLTHAVSSTTFPLEQPGHVVAGAGISRTRAGRAG